MVDGGDCSAFAFVDLEYAFAFGVEGEVHGAADHYGS